MEQDIFSDEEQQIEAPIEAVEAVPEPEAPVRDDKGRFAPKGVEESVSPTPVEEPQFDHAAVIGERKRRQEAEERTRLLEAQLQALANPPAPPPNIWEDEQGALDHVKNEAVTMAVQQATFNNKLDMSEMMVRQANTDFDDMKAKFLEMAEQNPSLRNQALADPHPWNKAYTIAKNAAKMEALGAVDVAELEAKLREQITAEMQAKTPANPLPNSLADAQSARGGGNPAVYQPYSLQDILGR
jgi:hypothetical protein